LSELAMILQLIEAFLAGLFRPDWDVEHSTI
jgi:hypothetical protein